MGLRARDIPNLISIARVILVFPVIWLLLYQDYRSAMALFFVAGISDALDGFLARQFHWQSRLGGILDPLADKFLLVSVYFCLGWLTALPLWLVILVILRDVIIVAGALAWHFRVEKLDAEPSLVSKANTSLQITLVLMVVYNLGFTALPQGLLNAMMWAVAFTTLWSGVDYVVSWGRKAGQQIRN
ncbi:CDP-alcohol phosphatidyltransferase family protein [Thiolapillus brandeum]|uniref:CDP-diacylglycerol--glycerol-3-phosphate 3-phosphatidyltransferase n=1 Tax=Thiolapillus brandeum TaxID=1076588 RepID=A0A7U6GK88_9GAMM|nr:CDP-alcohol phosphatidyltransferase family protein [Thiolapillus brandeum]BAO45195.1 CDP-diacylglycerol--glycerol-3-phosphate 3-phosphatidyltransferase [Thiolapillus brandeum]